MGPIQTINEARDGREVPLDEVPQVAITVDSDGNIVGDTSAIPAEILAQLQSPESQARIRDLYQSYHGGGTTQANSGKVIQMRKPHPDGRRESKRQPQFLNQGERRDFTAFRLPGQSRKDFRRGYRQYVKQMQKQARTA